MGNPIGAGPLPRDGAAAKALTDARTGIARLLDACVVLIPAGGLRGGSGFLVAPGAVLTCAHVVARTEDGATAWAARQAEFHWNGGVYSGTVRAVPEYRGDGDLWAHPDLALITCDGLPDGHPYAWLDDRLPNDHTRLYATGYKPTYGAMEVGGVWVDYDSPHDVFGQPKLSMSKGELAPGMSGGPILDPATGAVCGILTTAREPDSPYGGLGTPMSAVRERFPEIWASGRPPRDARWRAFRDELLARERLRNIGVESLLAVLAAMPEEHYDLLFDRVFDGLRPLPERPLRTPEDLIDEVADSVPAAGRPHPLERLRAEATAFAERPPGPRAARIEIHLSPAGHDVRKLLLAIWSHRVGSERCAVLEHCDDTAMPITDVRERLATVLVEVMRRLGGDDAAIEDLVVEFVMPFELLGGRDGHDAVDEWYVGKPYRLLGVQFPVIVRTCDRPYDALVHCRRRWRSLQERPPVLRWADCRARDSLEQLYASFQNSEPHAMLMVGYLPGDGRRREVLEAAFDAGLPAAIWRRTPCELDGRTCGKDGECAVAAFQKAISDRFSGRSFIELPGLIRTLRAEARAQARDVDHCGKALTVLWDDPTRPDPNGAALSAPQGATR
ncbi:trypsin-like peptidase domain-containing protein [Actinomadura sp. NEAU-AAG7]|uniref:VMAP-C domain-containing protein n=1 Tax=Actinomadura sp. NEAU-AAG7 TaxID=2839640 RepID=UPI00203288E4|nr:trypsin-like peptidase domain-containing protein [Actinomadura sp. NEAU-AAG7]